MSSNVRIDVDPVIICPYDSSHKIARSRIQKHLVKCEKNFPPDYKQQCPYDATHRVFEHEMIEHIESCPMKLSCPNDDRVPKYQEINPISESGMSEEDWDEGLNAPRANLFNEPTFEKLNVEQYTTITNVEGQPITTKRFSSTLRRPFGYSQSLMLDMSNEETDDEDDDVKSIASEIGVGRGQNLLGILRGRGFYRRGMRGGLLH